MHRDNARLHNTLHSLAPSDDTVNTAFMQFENNICEKITSKLKVLGDCPENLAERVHLAMNLVQSFAHESVFDNHDYIDYVAMQRIVSTTIIGLLK